jgi:radical SAM protein (TIGR01212 family)
MDVNKNNIPYLCIRNFQHFSPSVMKPYNDFSTFLRRHFTGKVQKISIHAGFTCPNRDGRKGFGGCTYCNNQTFSPDYCFTEKTVEQQLSDGIRFFSRKYPEMRYIAYFQSYTNTYGKPDELKKKYEEALSFPNVEGLIIGTRPDCVDGDLLDYFEELSKTTFLLIEYGLESTCDATLRFIHRGHTYADAVAAITETARRGIMTGAHLILGLPGESREMILSHADKISQLPLTTLKLHHLQIIRHTQMAKQYAAHPEWFHLFSVEEYLDLVVDFVQRLNPDFVIERFLSQSPGELLLAPNWGLKNHEFAAMVDKKLRLRPPQTANN